VNGSSFDEYVWNDPDPNDPQQWGTTGGGISDHFNFLPSWQSAVGVPQSVNDGHVGRGIPDVSANASFNSGYSGIIIGGKPAIGNGTSASSPLWAGLIAVINAALGHNVGFVNPALYSLGSGAFRDIVPGAGPVDNSNSGVTGYPAGVGWDACTGWGSPNGTALLAALQQTALLVGAASP
jgi:kumamolisin